MYLSTRAVYALVLAASRPARTSATLRWLASHAAAAALRAVSDA